MLRKIGYIGIVASMSKLSRPFLRKEWSFFFDQLSKGFTGKCSAFESLTSLTCQIGYNLFNKVVDIGSILLHHICLKLNSVNRSKVYYHIFIIMQLKSFISNYDEIFGIENIYAAYSQRNRLFLALKRTHDTKAATFGPMVYPARVVVVLSTFNPSIYNDSFFDGGLPHEPELQDPPVISQVNTQPIPTPILETNIEKHHVSSKPTSVASQKAPILRKRKIRMLPSSDSKDDDLTLDEINRKK